MRTKTMATKTYIRYMMSVITWISVQDKLPEEGIENSYLITDGLELGIGWYEAEYFAPDDSDEELRYSSEC